MGGKLKLFILTHRESVDALNAKPKLSLPKSKLNDTYYLPGGSSYDHRHYQRHRYIHYPLRAFKIISSICSPVLPLPPSLRSHTLWVCARGAGIAWILCAGVTWMAQGQHKLKKVVDSLSPGKIVLPVQVVMCSW